MSETAADYYQTGLDNSRQQIRRYEALINRFSFFRLFTIAAGIFLFYYSLKYENQWIPVLVFFIIILVFASLVRKQNQFEKKRNYFRDLSEVLANELSSIESRGNIYDNGSRWSDERHPYTSDLDIFGSRSLFELVNRCVSPGGNLRLAQWLQGPAAAGEADERQRAIQELACKRSWKHHFQALLLFANQSEEGHPENLFKYMRSAAEGRPAFLKFYLAVIPWIFLLVAALSWYFPFMILPLIVTGITNLFITQHYNARVMKAESQIGKMGRILSGLSGVVMAVEDENWDSELCKKLSEELKGGDKDSDLPGQIRRLSVLINQLAFGLSSVGPVMNLIMAWNVRQFFAIEDWKKLNKVNFHRAFDTIATFEALISLSSLRNNYPSWAFPRIVETRNYTLSAKEIGHPMISPGVRVLNDYHLQNELKIDIITGSNMAGKSTFLRTLGVNAVLALAGAPVCAEKMEVSRMLIFSYMRIRDSLNENTSTFKAELDRLKELLEMLKGKDKVFFLIDEMLRGTNSVDKYLGTKGVIEKLISRKAVGVIATHDLQIAELEQEHPGYIRNFYFDIEIDGDEMKFDYKLKAGECKTFNAALLLKRLGIN